MESEFSPDSPRFLSPGCIRPYDTPGRYIDDWRVGLTNQQLRMIIEGNRLMKAGRYRAALDLMKRATSGINIQLKPKLRDNIEKLQVFVDRENEVYKQQILSQHPQHEIDDERYRTVKALQRLSMAKLQSERLGNPCIKPQEDLMENVAMEQISRSMHVRPGVNKKEIAKDVFKRLNDMIEEYAPHKIEFHRLQEKKIEFMKLKAPALKKLAKDNNIKATGNKESIARRLAWDYMKHNPVKYDIDLTEMEELLQSVDMNELISFIVPGNVSLIRCDDPLSGNQYNRERNTTMMSPSCVPSKEYKDYYNPLYKCFLSCYYEWNKFRDGKYPSNRDETTDLLRYGEPSIWLLKEVKNNMLRIFQLLLKYIDCNHDSNIRVIFEIIRILNELESIRPHIYQRAFSYIEILIKNGLDMNKTFPYYTIHLTGFPRFHFIGEYAETEAIKYRSYNPNNQGELGLMSYLGFLGDNWDDFKYLVETPGAYQRLELSKSLHPRLGEGSMFESLDPMMIQEISENVNQLSNQPEMVGRYYDPNSLSLSFDSNDPLNQVDGGSKNKKKKRTRKKRIKRKVI